MRITELRKIIKSESRRQKADGIPAYIAYTWNDRLIANFCADLSATDDQLSRLLAEGLLIDAGDIDGTLLVV